MRRHDQRVLQPAHTLARILARGEPHAEQRRAQYERRETCSALQQAARVRRTAVRHSAVERAKKPIMRYVDHLYLPLYQRMSRSPRRTAYRAGRANIYALVRRRACERVRVAIPSLAGRTDCSTFLRSSALL